MQLTKNDTIHGQVKNKNNKHHSFILQVNLINLNTIVKSVEEPLKKFLKVSKSNKVQISETSHCIMLKKKQSKLIKLIKLVVRSKSLNHSPDKIRNIMAISSNQVKQKNKSFIEVSSHTI